MPTQDCPFELFFRISNSIIKISNNSIQFPCIESFRKVEIDVEEIMPIMKMSQIQVVVLCQISWHWSSEIFINCQSIIERAYLREVHRGSVYIEHLPHSFQKWLISHLHFFVNQILTINILFSLFIPILAIGHYYTVFDIYGKGQISIRQSICLLFAIIFYGKWRKIILLRNLRQFRSKTQRVQSIELASDAFKSSINISAKDFNRIGSVFTREKIQIINIVLSQHSSKILMLPHSNSCQFSPQLLSRITIIITIQMISCSMPKKTDHLLQLAFHSNYNGKKENQIIEKHFLLKIRVQILQLMMSIYESRINLFAKCILDSLDIQYCSNIKYKINQLPQQFIHFISQEMHANQLSSLIFSAAKVQNQFSS